MCFFPSSSEIVQNKGLEHITVDDLVAEITPKGRGEVLLVFCVCVCVCVCVRPVRLMWVHMCVLFSLVNTVMTVTRAL